MVKKKGFTKNVKPFQKIGLLASWIAAYLVGGILFLII